VANDVLGASAGGQSYFFIDHWKYEQTITEQQNDEQYVEISSPTNVSWVQWKIELRGVDTTIEELLTDASLFQESALENQP
jgi:hypothetical protein